MSGIEVIKDGDYEIHARAVPAGNKWAAEYAVTKHGETKIDWQRPNIIEGLLTHGAAILAARELAHEDIKNTLLHLPG